MFITSFVVVSLLLPVMRIHAAAPAFNPKDPANTQKLKDFETQLHSKKSSSADSLKTNENISGTITAISGTDITISLDNPSKGQSKTILVHTASADVSRTVAHVKSQKTKPGNDGLIKKLSTHTNATSERGMTVASAGFTVGDTVHVSGTKNAGGSITAKRVSAFAKKTQS